jgi:hypothetical protein
MLILLTLMKNNCSIGWVSRCARTASLDLQGPGTTDAPKTPIWHNKVLAARSINSGKTNWCSAASTRDERWVLSLQSSFFEWPGLESLPVHIIVPGLPDSQTDGIPGTK